MPARHALPRPSEPVLDSNGHFTVPWQNYLRTRFGDDVASETIAEIEAQIAALTLRVDELEEGGTAQLLGPESVRVIGTLQNGVVQFTLVGDNINPGPEYYYGTNALGNKGFHALPDPPPALVPYFIPALEIYTVPLYAQALFSMIIDVEGFIDVEGYLIEVD